MNFEPIIVVSGEPNSIFLEIFFKSLKKINIKSPIILIASLNLVKKEMKKLKYNFILNEIKTTDIRKTKLNNKKINIININLNNSKKFNKISQHSNEYIKNCFSVGLSILKKYKLNKFINGPINKKKFLKKKYLGITEYISKKFKINNYAMLIYNKNLSVCPITTHEPLKNVAKQINQKLVIEKIKLLNKFYVTKIKIKPKIAVLGLNPHCESNDKYNEDEMILKPAILELKNKNFFIEGPISADTIFLKKNRVKFDIIVGMYHDQVLTPIKTIYEYDAINITVGLPFLRISPDHGPNEKMVGKNISNPLSLIQAFKFLDKN